MANIRTPITKLKLNDGNSIPMLAYGTGTAWSKSDENQIDKELVKSMKTAISMGYNHIDGAEMYKTEPEMGVAIKECGVEREKIFITTKWAGVGDIKECVKKSLQKLQLDYLDLYLIHSPWYADNNEGLQKQWAVMEEIKEEGLAKSIGVSNFLPQHLDAVMKTAKITPAINQIEFHPYLQRSKLLEHHKKLGIATSAYGPLSPITKARPGPIDDFVASLAKKYAVSDSEICLRWCIDQDIVAVTTSSREQRMSDYLRCTTFKLTPTEIREIKTRGEEKHHRAFWGKRFAPDDRS
ncbi:Aldo/keto reductase [Patellaria atrata CBS 101060]|uniref:Aldo/keto reductase n=1 Tax=Patellaria atrata CBS 101060 TaxID=1346257 RepID=A0A9P4SDC7_9PEZI|nr:Aldo/keto reductase [Patellaria atrata CBS 101060]